ncbi:hypothetical protein [Piscinibacter sakaiensis]|uniref:hypothetical protein n=1 Tax=Piscinibacter sakaiensis TaxID=1547922 RepID=UPI003AAB5C38
MLLSACGTLAPPNPPSTTAPPPAVDRRPPLERRAALPAALSAERQWLQSWFDGTPVLIVQRGDGAIGIDVPIDFCFDPGQSKVKPALGAVLDKVAESLRRVRDARLPVVAAPPDADGRRALALQRADQVRRHLRSRGVEAARLGPASAAEISAVQLRIDSGDD